MSAFNFSRKSKAGYPQVSPSFGVPNEIVRYYFRIDDTTSPNTTYSPRPWSAADTALVTTQPPPIGPPPDFNFILPVPPCHLAKAAFSVVTSNSAGNITGQVINVQWRGILGNNPVITVPAPALGAPKPLLNVSALGSLAPGTITITNPDFSDVIVPLGGATIFPELQVQDLTVPAGSSFECFLAVGVVWNANLINAPFGP